ncbi:MAG: hypothetical protein FWG89_04395 [Treponema sp.]|nr:hypothetical protein [Treponema sp.]
MKRIIVCFLVSVFAVTGAFAQLTFGFHTEVNSYMFSSIIPTGMAAQKTMIDDQGYVVPNIGTNRLDAMWLIPESNGNQGYYIPSGGYSFFAPRVSSALNTEDFREYINYLSDMHININYSRGIMFASFTVHLRDILLNRLNGGWWSLNRTFDAVNFPDFTIGFDHSTFGLRVGSTEDPRAVSEYRDFTDWSMLTPDPTAPVQGLVSVNHVDGFGVLVPSNNAFIFNSAQNAFRYKNDPANPTMIRDFFTAVASLKMLDHFFDIPITVDLAMDFNTNFPINDGSTELAQERVNFGVAVRGSRIANLFNFDLLYKIRGGDGTLDDSYDSVNNPGGGLHYPQEGTEYSGLPHRRIHS